MLLLDATKTVDMPQVCFPFATDAKGQTLYEKMLEGKFLLGSGSEETSTQKTRRVRDTGSLLTVCLEEVCPSLKEALAHREGLTELPRRRWTHQKYAVGDWRVQGG